MVLAINGCQHTGLHAIGTSCNEVLPIASIHRNLSTLTPETCTTQSPSASLFSRDTRTVVSLSK